MTAIFDSYLKDFQQLASDVERRCVLIPDLSGGEYVTPGYDSQYIASPAFILMSYFVPSVYSMQEKKMLRSLRHIRILQTLANLLV